MSIALMNFVWDADLDAKSKLILLSLADNANDAGVCWPTQTTIARRASMSERSVRDYLHRLADEGLITVLELGNGRGLSTKYRLNLDAIKAAKAAEPDQKAAKTDVKAEDACRPIVISQPPSFNQPLPLAREDEGRTVLDEAYYRHFGHDPTSAIRHEMENLLQAHGEICFGWILGEVGGMAPDKRNWRIARFKFNDCATEGHGPRYVTRAPRTNGGGRGIRAGNGASERRPEGADSERHRPLTEAERLSRLAEIERVDQEIRASGSAS